MENTISPQPGSAKKTTIEAEMLVFGYLAAQWADSGKAYGCCMPDWGNEVKRRPIQVGSDRYVATKKTMELDGVPQLGVWLVRYIDALNGGEEREGWWIPMESFKEAKLTLPGVIKLDG